jgi:hypothetical protein
MAFRHNASGLPDSPLPTRRAFITRTAAAGAGIAIGSVAVTATQAASAISPALAEVFRRYAEAEAAYNAAADRLEVAYLERKRLCPPPECMAQHACPADFLRHLDGMERACRFALTIPERADDDGQHARPTAECEERLQEIAAQRIEIAQYQQRLEALGDGLGYPGLARLATDTGAALTNTEIAIAAFPAETLQDCKAKLVFCVDKDLLDEEAYGAVHHVIADLDRITAAARSIS